MSSYAGEIAEVRRSLYKSGVMAVSYCVPKREILAPMTIGKWIKSRAYDDLLTFISALNDSVKGKSLTEAGGQSQAVQNIIVLLDKLDQWINDIPPVDQPQRFGNKSYRDWHKRLVEESESLLHGVLSEEKLPATCELIPYLLDSFGNSTRIDYGTGHEVCFIIFLLCLVKINVLTSDDFVAIINGIFERYLKLCRRLQQVYRMEPAGSHGVWCLDDYQFLPFYFGSAQLIGNTKIEPNCFVKEGFAEKYADEYMFMGCIKYINQVKTGPFAEHSNQLWNISAVPSWQKVNTGLLKMYTNEVLAKFPVVQHFLFGSLFSIEPKDTSELAQKLPT